MATTTAPSEESTNGVTAEDYRMTVGSLFRKRISGNFAVTFFGEGILVVIERDRLAIQSGLETLREESGEGVVKVVFCVVQRREMFAGPVSE